TTTNAVPSFAIPIHAPLRETLFGRPLLERAVFDATDSVDAGNPDGPVPTMAEVEDPIERRGFTGIEFVRPEVIRSRAVQRTSDGHDDALRIVGHTHHHGRGRMRHDR